MNTPRFATTTLEFNKVKEQLAGFAATSLGGEYCLALRVSADFETVRGLQDQTAEAKLLLDESKRFPFGGVYDIKALVKRAQLGSVLEADELQKIQTTAQGVDAMQKFLLENSEKFPVLAELGRKLVPTPKLVRQLSQAISEKGEILDGASVKLAGLRAGILSAKARVRDKLESILHDPNNQKYFQDNLVTMRANRYVIPIKSEYRMNFPGVVHDQSGTGSTLFIEPLAVVNLNNDIKRYLAEEREEIERILRTLTAHVGAEAEHLNTGIVLLTEIDAIQARAQLAAAQRAVRPQLLTSPVVVIEKGRHPLLPKDSVVPLDISIGETFNTLLITGPNTGGKTVALKAVGLFALMAQIGLFIPALSAKLPVFQGIFADIGDEQSIEQSLSTFSGHMMNIIGILQRARRGDLVLVDEICAGTDPNEGAALAMSIIRNLHERGVLTIMTTHYSELKTFAYGQEGMLNASVEFNPETLLPTYRLLMGVPGSSNAFNISRKLGLQQEIIDAAGKYLTEEHVHMENVLQGLEGERRKYETESRELERLRYESEKLKNELTVQKRELERQKNFILRKAREQADELYRSSRRETEAVLKELRKLKRDSEAASLSEKAQEMRRRLDKHYSDDAPLPEGAPLTPETAKPGMKVFVTTLRQKGILKEINGKEGTVQVGILKTQIALEKCLLMSYALCTEGEAAKEKFRGAHGVNGALNAAASGKNFRRGYAQHQMFVEKASAALQETDLRGMTISEAIPFVDKAIDDAILAGMTRVRLIHGKGTGALRAGLWEYLKTHRSVKSFRMAASEAGGAGATEVELK